MGLKVHTSPDAFMKNNDANNLDGLLTQCEPKVKYSQWKRVEVDGKKKMKIIQYEVDKAEFKSIFQKEMKEFEAHANRVKIQYNQLKALKENLPKGHMIVQMDFAENYTCQSVEEVQSAYWNATMVTLHPAVAYYNEVEGESTSLNHHSTVFISEELSHHSLCHNTNKTIFHILTHHTQEFGVQASWHYFEAGHGKGPCDGVGGTTKRMADEAVRQQKATIQDADDFYRWTQREKENSKIKYLFVSKEDCKDAQKSIDDFGALQTVKGTMKLHAVITDDDVQDSIAVKDTSCFCVSCFENGSFNPKSLCGWRHARTKEITAQDATATSINVHAGDWVAAVYEKKWYIGQVKDVDEDDQDAKISFSVETRSRPVSFKWLATPDELWVSFEMILAVIQEPSSCGRTTRTFQFKAETIEMISSLFEQWSTMNK
ncbi:hypothetical protein AC249_AIPGENE6483 [Exaiptasia diaphana]|nr:hypothetical protein AC249_AIPGENE6483 [Exaiptasia diaphana]